MDNEALLVELEALLTRFEDALAREYDALRTRDAVALDDAIAAKTTLAQSLEQTARRAGLSGDHDPVPQTPAWDAIRERLQRCQQANRRNGAAIDASRGFVNSMIDILSGSGPSERTYDARGRLDQHGTRKAYTSV